ncbi:hypothetical protein KEJ50_03430 [Candidatus Bathyarchaeota archaeon]|nr:hypothetical protein [Candidatus Bathyarchaeota archaeon]
MKLNFKRNVLFTALILFTALLFRFYRLNSMGIDYYGDSYHHWLISYLTAKNNYFYTDFKPHTMNLVWLPLYHYLIAFLMNLTQIWDVSILHWFNLILGSVTCVLIYFLTLYISGEDYLSFFAGLSLALQPWFIELNVLGLTETLTVFLLILALIFYFHKAYFLPAIIGLLMLTRYEAWFFSGFLTLILLLQKKKRTFLNCIVIISLIVALWCLWSYINVSDSLAWFKMQKNMIEWDVVYLYGEVPLTINKLIEYPQLIMNITSNLFLLGLISGVLNFKKRSVFLIFLLTIFYTMLLSIQFFLGGLLLQARHAVYILPLTSILYANLFSNKRSLMNKAVLLLLTLLPTFAWGSMLNFKVDKSIEVKAGEALKEVYNGEGFIISDSPTIIYFSHVPPEKFYSTNNLFWYKDSWNKTQLRNWLLNHSIKYIVWENASYSASWWLIPELKEGSTVKLDGITFQLMFSEESSFLNIRIYKISYE